MPTNDFELTVPDLYIEITQTVMPKPVYLLTLQEAHKEYNSLMDQIQAKYEQLVSGEYGTVGTPAFNAEACELANLLACVSQLCKNWTCHLVQANILQALTIGRQFG